MLTLAGTLSTSMPEPVSGVLAMTWITGSSCTWATAVAGSAAINPANGQATERGRLICDAQFLTAGFRLRTMGAHLVDDFVVVPNEIRQAAGKIVEALPIRQTKNNLRERET